MSLTLTALDPVGPPTICSESTLCSETTLVNDGPSILTTVDGSLTYAAMNEGSLTLTAIVGAGSAYGSGSFGSGSYGSGGAATVLTFTALSEGSLTLTPA